MTDQAAARTLIPGTPPSLTYDGLAQAIHWLTLAAIVIAFGAGLVMEEMPRGPAKTQMVNLHASFGAVVMLLTALRLVWRVAAPIPAPLPGSSTMQFAMKAMDGMLYLLLLAIPVSGILMMGAKGRAFDVFGLFAVAPLIAAAPDLGKTLEGFHEVAFYLMLVLVVLHATAALFHQIVLRDGAMARMLPRGWLRRN